MCTHITVLHFVDLVTETGENEKGLGIPINNILYYTQLTHTTHERDHIPKRDRVLMSLRLS